MSMTADMSLMDILFDRDDPVLKFDGEDKEIKTEFDELAFKTDILGDKIGNWTANPDDFLNEILKDEPFSLLEDNLGLNLSDWKPVAADGSGVKEIIVGSDSNSSGQLSTGYQEDEDDEMLSSAVSSISGDTLDVKSEMDYTEEQVETDGSIFDIMETSQSQQEDQAVLGLLSQDSKTTSYSNLKKKVRQVVKVAPMVTNPRSVLLPVNTANGIRTYKIINGSNGIKTLKPVSTLNHNNSMVIKTLKPVPVPMVLKNSKNSNITTKKFKKYKNGGKDTGESEDDIAVVSDSDGDERMKSHYPRLVLSAEEKKLMQKEGVSLPTHYPLTKFEERELKRIRRKIRNKISAQDSRKRKKEYLDGLEDRVKKCTEENLSLVKKIKILQSQNQSLIMQLKKLQNTLAKTTTKTAQPATCLMVLMLSVALIMAPNLRLTQNTESEIPETDNSVTENNLSPVKGHSRHLLYSQTLPQEECTEEDKIASEYSPASPHSVTDSKISSGYDTEEERHYLADHDYDPPPSKRFRFGTDHGYTFNDEFKFDADGFGLSETEVTSSYEDDIKSQILDTVHEMTKKFGIFAEKEKPLISPPVDDVWPPLLKTDDKKELISPDVDDEWIPHTTQVKVNISDAKGTRTVVIQVPKEKK